jgi:ubiquinone/menaquinone biosynthesis C-methylase UbiE
VLDIGCGRGEMLKLCSEHKVNAVGIDYSNAALRIAQNALEHDKKSRLVKANALTLPFLDTKFDIVFMMDIVEHLYNDELESSLKEVSRVLKPGGRLIVHTVPNLNYYLYVYPIFRLMMKVGGKDLPKNPRERVYHGHVHVNEQNKRSLKKILAKTGFYVHKTWLKQMTGSWFKRTLSTLPLINHLLANDIFVLSEKNENRN